MNFYLSSHRQGLYFFMFPSLMKFYCNRIVDALIVNNIENVYISNDHSGDIYIISIILREIPEISVSYIQHGAVKKEFPTIDVIGGNVAT